MKKKMGIRALALTLCASMVLSASTGIVSAKNNGIGTSVTGDVSDASSVSESAVRSAAGSVNSAGVTVEGDTLTAVKAPSGLKGDGTQSSPYAIDSLSDLLLMNQYINYEGSSAKYFVLTQDIDLSKVRYSDFKDFEGVYALVSAKTSLSGNSNVCFHLDGNQHKLFGLNCVLPESVSAAAVFGIVNANSSVENLTIESSCLHVKRAADGAYALLAVQNFGTLKNITISECSLDLRMGVVEKSGTQSYLSDLACGRVYIGHAVGVADNAGKVQNFTVTSSDSSKGIFAKGARRYIGVIAGQNRQEISNVTVSGMRLISYGSSDSDAAVSGKGETASFIGGVAGSNLGSIRDGENAVIANAKVSYTFGADVMLGNIVGGIVGENSGKVQDSMVRGTAGASQSVSASSANFYGNGLMGGIAGNNVKTITGCGVYDIGMYASSKSSRTVFGGIAAQSSGSVSECAASGCINTLASSSAAAGGILGQAEPGISLSKNYALVSFETQSSAVGAVIGKNGTSSHIGQNNYWSSSISGLSSATPDEKSVQNDLSFAKPVILLPKNGAVLRADDLRAAWRGSASAGSADFSKSFVFSNSSVRVSRSSSAVSLTPSESWAYGELSYSVHFTVPVGIRGQKLSALVSVPVFAVASDSKGAGESVNNPIVLTHPAQLNILRYAPSAHYKLGADIVVDRGWTSVDFTGTLNGDGHTLTVSEPLFSSVTGSRDARVTDSNWKSVGTNLISGYIYDVKIAATSYVEGGVFGDVKNATLRDVTYAAADDSGFSLLTASRSGALINTLSGNDFLYRVRVTLPVSVTAKNAEGIGSLVGYIDAGQVVMDGCQSSALLACERNLSNVGGLIGHVASGNVQLNGCTATGCVYVQSHVGYVAPKIMIGFCKSNVQAQNCKYAVPAVSVSGGTVAADVAPFSDGISVIRTETVENVPAAELPELVLPEVFEEPEEIGLSTHTDGGTTVYEINNKADLLEMKDMLETDAAARAYTYELCADIDMGGDTFGFGLTYQNRFTGTFRGASKTDGKYTISNFTIPGLTAYTLYKSAAGLFPYANGATFDNFAIENASIENKGAGTAILVGYADSQGTVTGTATQCSFTNIDILDCTVTSTFTAASTLRAYNMASTVAQAGALVGALWSNITSGNIYTFENITVKDTTVSNTADNGNIGAYAIGGLIGDSRGKSDVCIGAAGSEPSIVMDNVTVEGYSMVGGVIGKAGNVAPTQTGTGTANGTGGLVINNVAVRNSSITAGGSVGTNGGCCAGIVAMEIVRVGGASVTNCSVTDTDIHSTCDITSITSYTTDCGGIAGHMSGTISDCTVKDCDIQSCTAGGIAGRSSRKAATQAGTLLTISNCQVIGSTTISVTSVNNCEAGGILSGARNAGITIDNCSVGKDVVISGHFMYAGGFIGFAVGADNLYTVDVTDSVMLATINTLEEITGSVVGGAVGESQKSNSMHIENCVIGGVLNNNRSYCGGVIGEHTKQDLATDLIKDCTIIAELNTNTSITPGTAAKLMANCSQGYLASGWMGNLSTAMNGNIVSSYPQVYPYLGVYLGSKSFEGGNEDNYVPDYTGVIEDINKPDGTNYVHGSADSVEIDGSQLNPPTKTVAVTNTTAYDNNTRLAYDSTTNATLKQVNGWKSLANSSLTVDSGTTKTSVVMTAKKVAADAGVTSSYNIVGFADPETNDALQISVMIPVVCVNIEAADLDGSGTASDPFLIHTIEELDSLRSRDLSKNEVYALAANITFDANEFGAAFSPITGSSDTVFNGTLTGYYNDTQYTLSGMQIGGSGDYIGLFASTDGATFDHFSMTDSTVTGTGLYTGGLVGHAANTTFTDVSLNNVTVTGSVYAGALAAYVVDTNTSSATLSASTVQNAFFTGGLFGHAHASGNSGTSNAITNTTINGITVRSASLDTTTQYDGSNDGRVDIAAAIAAEFSGTITTASISGTVTVQGSVASGAVGLVDPTIGNASISGVSVGGTSSISSTRTLVDYVSAAGIVGKVGVKDQISESTATVSLTVANCSVDSGVSISANYYAGGIVGSSGMRLGTISLSNTTSFAGVSASLADSAVSAIAARVNALANLSVDHAVAGGTLTGGANIGGVVGAATGVAVPASSSIISNTVVSASMSDAAQKRGILIGTVSTSVLPTSISPSPFTNIYYSSFRLDGVTMTGDGAYSDYQTSYYDLQSAVTYSDGSKTLPLSSSVLTLTSSSLILPAGISTGDYTSFTCSTNVPFVLDTVVAENNGSPLFSFDDATQSFTLNSSGNGYAVFRYENGIEIGFTVVASNISGQGTVESPYLIENFEHLSMLTTFPSKHYILARNLDFSTTEGSAWLSNYGTWVQQLTTTPFSGSLDGLYYPYVEATGDTAGHYDENAAQVVHSFSNLNVSTSAASIGLIPILASGASVQNLVFDTATVAFAASGTSDATLANVGVVVGENRGTITNVNVSGSEVSGNNHVGAIAGVSYGTITNCTVSSGTEVTSDHSAGGVVGGGATVTGCTVNGAVVTGTDMAGGIAGGNLDISSGTTGEVVSADKALVRDCTFEDCHIVGTTVQTTATSTQSFAGGVLGKAEIAEATNYRTVKILRCTLDVDSSVCALATAANATGQSNYAGGMLGFMQTFYQGMEIRSCAVYGTVRAEGVYTTGSAIRTCAGGIIGSNTAGTTYRVAENGNGDATFKFVNNICSGKVESADYAGAVAGRLIFNRAANYQLSTTSGDFMSGNIISTEFAALTSSSSDFGILSGYIGSGCFVTPDSSALNIKDNYYTSYVCKRVYPTLTEFCSGSPIQDCKLYDIATITSVVDGNTEKSSSFLVKNLQLVEGSETEYELSEYNDLVTVLDGTFARTDVKPAKLVFTMDSADSDDFMIPSTSLLVYSGVDSAEQHTLALSGFSIDPSSSAYYEAECITDSGRYAASLTTKQRPAGVIGQSLIADLGYGLITGLGITFDTDEDGTINHPYRIPNAEVFAHYFFSDWAADNNNHYLTNYYEQTADISFTDIVTAIANLGEGYRRNTFAPIGTFDAKFTGGYNGGGHVISDFAYTVPAAESAAITDVGLFGVVGDASTQDNDYRLKNLHIELAENGQDTNGNDVPSLSGGTNIGGLVGRYLSACDIDNCSVVYGLISSDAASNVGGLVGEFASANVSGVTIGNCFTSTNVHVKETWTSGSDGAVENFRAGGLVGSSDVPAGVALKFDHCFCSSDVVAPKYASSYIGRSNAGTRASLENCASTATVTSLSQMLSAGTDNTSIVVSYENNVLVTANSVYVAGMNTTGYAAFNLNNGQYEQFYTTLFGNTPMDSSSSSVYYDADVIGRISIPSGGIAAPGMLKVNGKYANSIATDDSENTTTITTSSTKELTSGTFTGLNAESWTISAGLYPVLIKSGDADDYFAVFSKLSALPVFVDSREASDTDESGDRTYAGVTYPVTISRTLDSSALSITSSKYSDVGSTAVYPTGLDTALTGNGSDKNTDLLFKVDTDEYTILRNAYLDCSDTSTPRNERNPYVQLSGTVDGRAVHRTIRIGLRSSRNTVYVATERQLRAIANDAFDSQGRFYDAYYRACLDNKNIRICADIELNSSIAFKPIDGYVGGTGNLDEGNFGFDGSNCEISNLTISGSGTASEAVGMFSSFVSGSPKISNLILRNVNVTGTSANGYTGALVGRIAGTVTLYEINNCLVIGGTVDGKYVTGGMIGEATGPSLTNGNISNVGVVGLNVTETTTASSTDEFNAAGLLAGRILTSTVSNLYAVGELKTNAKRVGGLAGVVAGSTVTGVVTSGYVSGSDAEGFVGGVVGRMEESTSSLSNAESTAFVIGSGTVGGIVGSGAAGSISQVIFAGSVYNGTGTARSRIMGGGSASVTTAGYDKLLQLETESNTAYTGATTYELVTGSGTLGQLSNFNYENAPLYYPNPVSFVVAQYEYGKIGHVISDAFKTGLEFALARFNLTYGGSAGSLSAYDQISMTSPVGDNEADTVKITEDRSLFSADTTMYLKENASGLEPNLYKRDTLTGVRADLNRTGSASFNGCDTAIYRYLVVKVVRTVEVDYVLNYDSTSSGIGSDSDKIALMLRTEDSADGESLVYTSNAVTSKFQDAYEAGDSGAYTVKFKKILVPDNKIYLDTLLPDGYKAEYTVENNTTYVGTLASADGQNYVDLSGVTGTTQNLKVRVNVNVTADPGWGLRDLTGSLTGA